MSTQLAYQYVGIPKCVHTGVYTLSSRVHRYHFSVMVCKYKKDPGEDIIAHYLKYKSNNPYFTNGFSHHYHLGESIFIFRGIRSDF